MSYGIQARTEDTTLTHIIILKHGSD